MSYNEKYTAKKLIKAVSVMQEKIKIMKKYIKELRQVEVDILESLNTFSDFDLSMKESDILSSILDKSKKEKKRLVELIFEDVLNYKDTQLIITSFADGLLSLGGEINGVTLEIVIKADSNFFNGMSIEDVMNSKRIDYIEINAYKNDSKI